MRGEQQKRQKQVRMELSKGREIGSSQTTEERRKEPNNKETKRKDVAKQQKKKDQATKYERKELINGSREAGKKEIKGGWQKKRIRMIIIFTVIDSKDAKTSSDDCIDNIVNDSPREDYIHNVNNDNEFDNRDNNNNNINSSYNNDHHNNKGSDNNRDIIMLF